jgi:hypothetical protein
MSSKLIITLHPATKKIDVRSSGAPLTAFDGAALCMQVAMSLMQLDAQQRDMLVGKASPFIPTDGAAAGADMGGAAGTLEPPAAS